MADFITIIASTAPILSPSFSFDLIKAPRGFPVPLLPETEALRTRGVNGQVWREVHKQFTPFPMMALKYFLTFQEAIDFANDIRFCKNSFLLINSEAHGVHNNIFCNSVEPIPRSGQGAGPSIQANTQALVICQFSLVRS